MARELVAIIKHDCPVCVELLPALDAAAQDGAPLRIVSQSGGGDTAALWERLRLVSDYLVDYPDDQTERSRCHRAFYEPPEAPLEQAAG